RDRRGPEERLSIGTVLVRGGVVGIAGHLEGDDLALVRGVRRRGEGVVRLPDDGLRGGKGYPAGEEHAADDQSRDQSQSLQSVPGLAHHTELYARSAPRDWRVSQAVGVTL